MTEYHLWHVIDDTGWFHIAGPFATEAEAWDLAAELPTPDYDTEGHVVSEYQP